MEEIPKDDVLNGLDAATSATQKRKYHKTRHAPEILADLDSRKVRAAAPACDRFFLALEQFMAQRT